MKGTENTWAYLASPRTDEGFGTDGTFDAVCEWVALISNLGVNYNFHISSFIEV
jgi:hypothetical protein